MTQPARVAVAYSGGLDSTALLHATSVAARDAGVTVLALHVHHGLSPHADAWLAHGEAQCARWAKRGLPVEFIARRLSGKPGRGESVEAWARRGRYEALREMALAHGATVVLLAQHRRDQAETLLLQALRGAGVAGLAGMPRSVEREGITWARPWLSRPREAIEAYARRHRLKHIEDDSNTDPRYARNRLRLAVWPALTESFPDAEASIAAAATWAADAAAGLAELAVFDLAGCADAGGGLRLERWAALSPARRGNALREWLRRQTGALAASSLVQRLLTEVPAAREGRWPIAGGELRHHRGLLTHAPAKPATPPAAERETTLSLSSAGTVALPGWGGRLRAVRVKEGGVPLAWLARLELRRREGGEQFQAGPGRPPRSLKKQFQAVGVPAWCRDSPLCFSGGQLVFVPGLGLDARVIGSPGQPLVRLEWLPLSARPGRAKAQS